MRIVYDVSPLTHPRTGVGNYIRGALAGMAQVGDGEHELVAFAPASLRGRDRLDAALDGIDAGAKATSSCSPVAAWAIPASAPRM